MTSPTDVAAPIDTAAKSRRWPWVAGIAAAFLLGIAIGGSGSNADQTATSPAPNAMPLTSSSAPAMANLPATIPTKSFQDRFISGEDGTYEIGKEIQPGTYKADPSAQCYWARLASSNESDIKDNHLADGRTTVVIQSNDAAFVTHDCGTWVKVS